MDEFRSSQRCCACHQPMEGVQLRPPGALHAAHNGKQLHGCIILLGMLGSIRPVHAAVLDYR